MRLEPARPSRRRRVAALAALLAVVVSGCSSAGGVAGNTTFAPPPSGGTIVGATLVFPPIDDDELVRVTYRALPPSSPLARAVQLPRALARHAVLAGCSADDAGHVVRYQLYRGLSRTHPVEVGRIRCDGTRHGFTSSVPLRGRVTLSLTGDLDGVTGAYAVLDRLG
jgi:hypothetical protein